MQRSSVDFPEPDAPNTMVIPGAVSIATSRMNCSERRLRIDAVSRRVTTAREPPRASEDRVHAASTAKEKTRRSNAVVGGRVLKALHLVVNGDGHGPGDAGEIPANHQHHAEFAKRVRKTQDGAGHDPVDRQRHDDAEERAPSRGAQRRGGFEEAGDRPGRTPTAIGCTANGRLYRIDARTSASNVKARPWPVHAVQARPRGLCDPMREQHVQSEDRGRQHQREGDDGFDQESSAPPGERQPVRDRQTDHEQDQRRQSPRA